MTDAWILVFYAVLVTAGRPVGGGPATAEFADLRSCQMALHEIARGSNGVLVGQIQVEWATCIQKEVRD